MRLVARCGALGAFAVLTWPAAAMATEMRGVTATEIKIGREIQRASGPKA